MSDIRGDGHGKNHVWQHIGSVQLEHHQPKEMKCTIYKCRACGITFDHYYGREARIFVAMMLAEVPEQCKAKTQ